MHAEPRLTEATSTQGWPTKAPAAGWRMPAEWAPHERCWMAFPSRTGPWGDYLPHVQQDIATLAHAVRRFEPVTMVVAPDEIADAAAALGPDIALFPLAVDDLWIRDTGPTSFPTMPAASLRRSGNSMFGARSSPVTTTIEAWRNALLTA